MGLIDYQKQKQLSLSVPPGNPSNRYTSIRFNLTFLRTSTIATLVRSPISKPHNFN